MKKHELLALTLVCALVFGSVAGYTSMKAEAAGEMVLTAETVSGGDEGGGTVSGGDEGGSTTAPTTEPGGDEGGSTTAPSTEPGGDEGGGTVSGGDEGSTPTPAPSTEPSAAPSTEPSAAPSTEPSAAPSTAPSAAPTTAPSAEEVNNALDEAASALEGNDVTADNAADKVEDVVAEIGGVDNLAAEMQTGAAVEKVTALEDAYTKKANITVKQPEVKDDVKTIVSSVSAVGVGLNGDANETVNLVVEAPAQKVTVSEANYGKNVQLDIKLSNDKGELRVPVTITMPVPKGIDSSKLEILHYGSKGTEVVEFKLEGANITFTVTHFSTFAFAEKKDDVNTETGSQPVSDEDDDDEDDSSADGQAEEASAPQSVFYTVVKGDNMSKIAKKYGVTLAQLIALNPQITNPSRIYPGQVITISLSGGSTAANTVVSSALATEYIVQKGDTLYKIAGTHKMSLENLRTLNPDLFNQKYIHPGQRVRLK